MPLLQRKPFEPVAVPNESDLRASNKEWFFVRATGEAYDDYAQYVKRMQLLRSRVWSCRFSGKGKLTFDEASREEERWRAMLTKFPAELESQILHLVHHHVSSLDQLVNKVYDALKPVAPAESPAAQGKENEQAAEAPAAPAQVSAPAAKGPKAPKHPLNKQLTRCWIIENCQQHDLVENKKLWAANADLAAKHGLPQAIPDAFVLKKPAASKVAGAAGSPSPRKPIKKGPRTMEEQAAAMTAGSVRHVAFTLLKDAGRAGCTAAELAKRAVEKQVWTEEDAKTKSKQLGTVLSANPEIFARRDKGVYALAVLIPGYYKELDRKTALSLSNTTPTQGAQQGAPRQGPPKRKAPSAEEAAAAAAADAAAAAAAKETDPLAKATLLVEAAQQRVLQLKANVKQDEQHLQAARQALEKGPSSATSAGASSPKDPAAAQRAKAAEVARQQDALEALRRQVAMAEKQLLDAHRQLSKEQAHADRRRAKAEAEAARQEAKKYPMEDMQLLAELTDKAKEAGQPLPPPEVPTFTTRYNHEESNRLLTALYVADFLSQFLKPLATCEGPLSEALEVSVEMDEDLPSSMTLGVLDDMLGIGLLTTTTNDTPPPPPRNTTSLYALYVTLLRAIIDHHNAGPLFELWYKLLHGATWPEVLRRYVAHKGTLEQTMVPDAVKLVCALLAGGDADSLHCDQHLVLLQFLCNEALDTECVRGLLEDRLEQADEAKRELREAMGETRKRLRDAMDGEKEERRKRREADAARKEALLVRRQQLEEMRAAAEKEGKELPPDLLKQLVEEDVEASHADAMDVDPPSFQLPPELQEYTGKPNDRKAQLQFRQAQQAARKRLDKERAKWQADLRAREREREATARAEAEAQRALQKEKLSAQDMLAKQQEAYDKVVDRHAIRRAPLGWDRHYRAYWVGLAGQKGVLYCQDPDGTLARATTVSEVEAMVDVLDRRGLREGALLDAMDKHNILDMLSRAEKRQAETKQPAVVERVQPSRRGKPQGKAAKVDEVDDDDEGAHPTVEAQAAEYAAAALKRLAVVLRKLKCKCPGTTWKAFEGELASVEKGNADVEGDMYAWLKQRALALEGCMYAVSKDAKEEAREETPSEEEEDNDNEAPEDMLMSPGTMVVTMAEELDKEAGTRREKGRLWGTRKQRDLWLADVQGAATLARVAYCAGALEEVGDGFVPVVGSK